mmetsp:Transcript_30235/g.89653  ORF Transcript_30235/g.89653 Transcript_30235/m.89653 type:complete len:93 (+) Transcript_30235:125-403(+)
MGGGHSWFRDGRLQGGWQLAQTNDDHFREPGDCRRCEEPKRLSTLDRDTFSDEWMMKEMANLAIYNTQTIYSTVYVPKTGYHKMLAHPESVR